MIFTALFIYAYSTRTALYETARENFLLCASSCNATYRNVSCFIRSSSIKAKLFSACVYIKPCKLTLSINLVTSKTHFFCCSFWLCKCASVSTKTTRSLDNNRSEKSSCVFREVSYGSLL
jgi:hypothetical protein